MSQFTEQYKRETGQVAMYRKECSDYHTLGYVNWLEAKVANLPAHNSSIMQLLQEWVTMEHQQDGASREYVSDLSRRTYAVLAQQHN